MNKFEENIWKTLQILRIWYQLVFYRLWREAVQIKPVMKLHLAQSFWKWFETTEQQLLWSTICFCPLWDSFQNKIISLCLWPFAVVHARLTYLPQDVLGVDEGSAVTDVIHHHKAVRPVHRLLQNTPGLRALPRTMHTFILVIHWAD